jgi:hypothetical protein
MRRFQVNSRLGERS